jgi:hypothetical protein
MDALGHTQETNLSYHRKVKHSDHSHKGTHYGFTLHGGDAGELGCTIHTDGPGSWMKVPETAQQPKEQQPPTEAKPVRMHHRMALPYKRGP